MNQLAFFALKSNLQERACVKKTCHCREVFGRLLSKVKMLESTVRFTKMMGPFSPTHFLNSSSTRKERRPWQKVFLHKTAGWPKRPVPEM